jgi:predicted ATPase
MIRVIDIRNFKSIKSGIFPLANLNVLLGLNGHGKSSMIQALLLLRQSKATLDSGILQLNGSEIEIGSTKDALYQYTEKGEGLCFDIAFDDEDYTSLQFNYQAAADIFNRVNIETDTHGLPEKIVDFNQPLFSNNFQYLNANRVEPLSIHKTSYSFVVTMGNIGSRGQYTVDYLETRGNEEVEFENLIHPDTASSLNNVGQTVRDKRLINQVTLWMREISPGIGIRTTSVSGDNVKLEYEYEQKTFGKTNTFKPENVGFGISYALHVVVSLLKAKPGSLIIIENPESHVHPRGQAELGKLIALLAKNDVQIIVETHSDHILNGIRVGVKEDSSLKDRTILFYFDKEFTDTEQYSRITEIKIDKNGTLSHYPDNLLTEWSNMLARLV